MKSLLKNYENVTNLNFDYEEVTENEPDKMRQLLRNYAILMTVFLRGKILAVLGIYTDARENLLEVSTITYDFPPITMLRIEAEKVFNEIEDKVKSCQNFEFSAKIN